MTKKAVAGLAVVLALMAMPVSSNAETGAYAILDTPGGVKVVPVDGGLDHDAVCGGEAPLEFYCSNANHTRVTGLSHGFLLPYPDEATLESRVIFEGGARLFRCTFEGGALSSCAGSGSFPPVGAAFTHDCFAYLPGSPTLPLAPAEGTPLGVPGGLGVWNCQVRLHG